MNRLVAALVLGLLVFGIPMVAIGIFGAANVAFWRWLTYMRKYDWPQEAYKNLYVPSLVQVGIYPLGAIFALCLLAGLMLFWMGQAGDIGAVRDLGKGVAWFSGGLLVLVGFGCMWAEIFRQPSLEEPRHIKTSRQAIQDLSSEGPHSDTLVALHHRYWMASHRIRLLQYEFHNNLRSYRTFLSLSGKLALPQDIATRMKAEIESAM